MSRYTHTLRGQTAKAVESLPDLSIPDRQAQKKTGTDDCSPAVASGDKRTSKPEAGSENFAIYLAKHGGDGRI